MNNNNIEIMTFNVCHLVAVKSFTDTWIGMNYFDIDELKDIQLQSISNNINCSFLAFHKSKLVGIRLTLAPGKWAINKSLKITPKKWPSTEDDTAYFKSLFIHKDYQKQGIGKLLSNESISKIKTLSGQAIVCHSWKESPNNSSIKYLEKMGFKSIKEHQLFWNHIDYNCIRCTPQKCVCTAIEMHLELK